MNRSGLGQAYHAGGHYENFPVASWLFPPEVRPVVLRLYQFARHADDLADEGEQTAEERLSLLKELSKGLFSDPPDPDCLGGRLALDLRERGIPLAWAQALLEAFMADVLHEPMPSQEAVLEYCRKSANPVGQLLLAITGFIKPEEAALSCDAGQTGPGQLLALSNAICSGLQIANFAQDLGEDLQRGRIYFPQPCWPKNWRPEMGLSAIDVPNRVKISRYMASWASELLHSGRRLPALLMKQENPHRLRFAYEISLTLEGGLAICRWVDRHPLAVWQHSPQLSKWQLPLIGLRAATRLF